MTDSIAFPDSRRTSETYVTLYSHIKTDPLSQSSNILCFTCDFVNVPNLLILIWMEIVFPTFYHLLRCCWGSERRREVFDQWLIDQCKQLHTGWMQLPLAFLGNSTVKTSGMRCRCCVLVLRITDSEDVIVDWTLMKNLDNSLEKHVENALKCDMANIVKRC